MASPYYPKATPQEWPVGECLPPGNVHAVSVSLPTWDSIVRWGKKETALVDSLKTGYPRFFVHRLIQKLELEVLTRLKADPTTTKCMLFPTPASSARCFAFMQETIPSDVLALWTFRLPADLPSGFAEEDAKWAQLDAVLYPADQQLTAMAFWRQSECGISSRHAQYLSTLLDLLVPACHGIEVPQSEAKVEIRDIPKLGTAEKESAFLKTFIADLASNKETTVKASDVLLFSKGMEAIYAVARAFKDMGQDGPDSAIVYGFPYAETVKVNEMVKWTKFHLYGFGTKQELDDLEARLEGGERISASFCEIPSNPQLASPDLARLRGLADKYHFPIACDETVGSFVNVDTLPYVDVVMTSLTKIFSGGCDVMGGSVIVNPRSPYYAAIHRALAATWEDTYFPLDVIQMSINCRDVVERVRKANGTTEIIADLINSHPSVAKVYYPKLVPSRHSYDRCKKEGGGYGYLWSIIFHDADAAIRFYENLRVPKGPSLGTNFTLAVPYAQIAHFKELEWAAQYDVLPHMIRISVGLEDAQELVKTVEAALAHAAG